MIPRPALILTALAALGLASASPASAQPLSPASVARGQTLAKQACSFCHAISGPGPSKNKDAPPFATLLQTFPGRNLDEILAQGMMTQHPPMPVFLATSQNMDDLLAYLTSVQVHRVASLDRIPR
jgi:cytochrome c553